MAIGCFVTVDGIGGAGKTTIANAVVDMLNQQGLSALYTREPTDLPIGRVVREQFEAVSGYSLAALVAADRFEHLATVIDPARQAGTIVVCDRYVASSLVLQTLDGVPEDYVEKLNEPATKPDLAILLTAEPQTAWTRIAQRGSHGRFEQRAEQSTAEHLAFQRVGDLLRSRGWKVATFSTDTADPDVVAEAIVSLIRRL